MSEAGKPRLEGEDKQLVDLVTAVLVDPNIHTDARLRLDQQITEILRSADGDVYRRSSREVHARSHAPRPAHERHDTYVHGAPEVLSSVLVDPNLHTDMRMRIHQEISEILAEASANASGRPSGALRS
jgi:ribosome maturation protein Sdo1